MALSGARGQEIKTELLYYILPFVYNPVIRNKLNSSRVNSNLKSLLNNEIKNELLNVESSINNFRLKSNEALITLSNLVEVEIAEYISISSGATIHYFSEKDKHLREYFKAAFNLGVILSKEDHRKIFFSL